MTTKRGNEYELERRSLRNSKIILEESKKNHQILVMCIRFKLLKIVKRSPSSNKARTKNMIEKYEF